MKQFKKATQATVQSIDSVSKVIQTINEISTNIAAAVEEQDAATLEIARGAEHTASSTSSVLTTMDDLTQSTENTKKEAEKIEKDFTALLNKNNILKSQVKSFLTSITATQDEKIIQNSETLKSYLPKDLYEIYQNLIEKNNLFYTDIKKSKDHLTQKEFFSYYKTMIQKAETTEKIFITSNTLINHYTSYKTKIDTLLNQKNPSATDSLILLGTFLNWIENLQTDLKKTKINTV